MFIDTHCHLTFPDFQNDIQDVVSRASEAGINRIIVPSISLETSLQAIKLAERFEQIYATVGVHPQDSQKYNESQLAEFSELSKHPKVVAIGEIGLDYYRDYAPHDVQKEVFKTFLFLAVETGLPLVIHNRYAFSDLIKILNQKEFASLGGVFHCFSEEEKEASLVFEMGFFISFTGTITFKKSKSAQIAQKILLEKQLLETDAPFMAPVPNRGKRNEPAFIRNVAEKQAELHNVELGEVAKKTSNLAFQIFPKMMRF
jgi:TatD DNase family protein